MTSCKFCGKKEPVMFCICPDCADKLQPQWVSVKERMPEEGEMTLVAVSGKPRKNITLKNAVELAAGSDCCSRKPQISSEITAKANCLFLKKELTIRLFVV